MSENRFLKFQFYFTGVVTLSIWALLVWDFFHGGIPSHHILAREDLPKISNAWGGLLLPLLTWFLLLRTKKRAIMPHADSRQSYMPPLPIVYGFVGGLVFGIALSTFFTLGNHDVPGYMLMGLLGAALLVPVHRAECLLGFVIGMTFTFGAILPTGVGTILSLICLVLHKYIRTLIVFTFRKLTNSSK